VPDDRIGARRGAKNAADRGSDIALRLVRPAVEAWMRRVAARTDIVDPAVDFRRTEPFLLLANHSFAMDVVQVPLPFRITPQIVASRDLFVDPLERFVLTRVARCIMATKGGGDLRTINGIMRAVDAGYPVLVFPQGDIPFYGEGAPVPRSAAMLARKLGLDLVTCRVSGGYLSSPRWAKVPREGRAITLEYRLAMDAGRVRTAGLPELHAAIEGNLAHDEYEWQRGAMVAHPCAAPAEGLEDILYACPACGTLLGIETRGDILRCRHCGTTGRLDEYGFISGFPVDTPGAWDRFQRAHDGALRASTFSSGGTLFIHDYEALRRKKAGRVQAAWNDGVLSLSGAVDRSFPAEALSEVAMTGRTDLNFHAEGTDWVLRLDALTVPFLRACQDRY